MKGKSKKRNCISIMLHAWNSNDGLWRSEDYIR